jgi:hypothetical protein
MTTGRLAVVIKQQGMFGDSHGSHFDFLFLNNVLNSFLNMSSAYNLNVKRRLSPNSGLAL